MDDILINITKYLPHRSPMLMVDIILNMDDEKVETIFDIKADNIFIEKDFLAASGLIENMAQTCSSVVAKDYFVDANNHDKKDVDVVGFISAIKTLEIHKLPKVGDTINTIATLVSKFVTNEYSLCTMNCKTFHDKELLLEGEINLFIQKNHSNH